MMSYRYDREKKKRSKWYFAGIILLILFFFTSLPQLIFDVLERPLESAWKQSQKNKEELTGFFHQFYSKSKLLDTQDELQKKIAQLEVDVLRTQYLESVLSEYKKIEEYNSKTLLAEVTTRAPHSSAGTLVIDAGAQDGVITGDHVFTAENLLLGTIARVYDHSSQVNLYTKAGQETPAVLYPHSESFSLIGNGKGYRAELNRNVEVKEGDVAYSQYEPGRIIAVVQKVIFDPRDPFKHVFLSVPLDMNTIQTVGIISPSELPLSLPITETNTD